MKQYEISFTLKKKKKDLNRVHCFFKEYYSIPKRVTKRIKDMLDQFSMPIDFFVLGYYAVGKEKYKDILSGKSIFKCF